MSQIFQNVYPFTTENIAGYLPLMKVKDQDVLTVGSSADQALNALLLGANKVVLYDINPNTYEYLKLKKNLILNTTRERIYEKIINMNQIPKTEELFSWKDLQNMNLYLKDDDSYQHLQSILQEKEIEFVLGDIFQMDQIINNDKFDRIIFSNILQYLSIFSDFQKVTEEELLKDSFRKWISYLNEDGILQLIYYYGINGNISDYIKKCNSLKEYMLYLISFPDFQNKGEDGIVIYKKTRRD